MKTYSFHYARTIIRFPVKGISLQKMDVRIRILLRKKEPVGKEAESTIYWDRIQILPKINHFEGSVETGMNGNGSHPNHENH